MPRYTKTEQAEAVEYLKQRIKPGTEVYLVLRKASRSGMSREIDVFTIEGNLPNFYACCVATALGWGVSKNQDAVKVQGCGMDMGFHLVDCLTRALGYPAYSLKHRWL